MAMRRKQQRRSGREATQREVIRDVLVVAKRYGAWMTLRELARLTGYGEASISAQLRHLRKEQYGGFAVAKRRRDGELGLTGGPVWEYGLAGKERRRGRKGGAGSRVRLAARKRSHEIGKLKSGGKAARRRRSPQRVGLGQAALPRGAR